MRVTRDVVVAGAATRDLIPGDPLGWRPGGGVAYGALLLARLGLRVTAIVGLDPDALDAGEPVALRAAGVDVRPVALARGPVFENREGDAGRVQLCLSASDPIPASSLPDDCRAAPAYLLAPVAGELGDDWAAQLPPASLVALAWQGLLRDLVPGGRTRARPPHVTRLVARADLIGVSREDLASAGDATPLDAVLAPGQGLALTAGRAGGIWLRRTVPGRLAARRWRAVPAREEIDPVGTGDVFLAVLLAGMIIQGRRDARAGTVAGPAPPAVIRDALGAGPWLRCAAVAASLTVEGGGLAGVPDLPAIRARLADIGREPGGGTG